MLRPMFVKNFMRTRCTFSTDCSRDLMIFRVDSEIFIPLSTDWSVRLISIFYDIFTQISVLFGGFIYLIDFNYFYFQWDSVFMKKQIPSVWYTYEYIQISTDLGLVFCSIGLLTVPFYQPMICYLSATSLLFFCYLNAISLLLFCYLNATFLLLICYLNASFSFF